MISRFSFSQNANLAEYLVSRTPPFPDASYHPPLKVTWNMPGKVQLLLNEGINSLDEGKFSQAIYNLDSVVAIDPKILPAWYYRGVAHLRSNNWALAERDFNQCNILNRQCAEANFELGVLRMRGRDFMKAKKAFERTISLNPSLAVAWHYRALIEVYRMELGRASSYLEKSFKVDPHYAPARLMYALLQADLDHPAPRDLKEMTKVISADSAYAAGWFWRGFFYASLNKFDECLKDWNRVIDLNPGNIFFLMMRGLIYIEKEEYENAFKDLRKAIEGSNVSESEYRGGNTILDNKIELQFGISYLIRHGYGLKDETFTLLRKGVCLLLIKKPLLAFQCFESAEALEPSPTGEYLKGIAKNQLLDYSSAMTSFDKAILADADNLGAHVQRSGIYRNQKKYPEAKADIDAAVRLGEGSMPLLSIRVDLMMEFHDYIACMNDLSQLLKKDSLNSNFLNMRAEARAALGDPSGANADLLSIPEEERDDFVHKQIMVNHIKAKDTVAAVAYYRLIHPDPSLIERLVAASVFADWRQVEAAKAEMNIYREAIQVPPGKDDPTREIADIALMVVAAKLDLIAANYSDARKKLNEVIEHNPRDLEPYYLRGKAYIGLKQYGKAKADLGYVAVADFRDSRALLKKIEHP